MSEYFNLLSFGSNGWGDELLLGAWLTIKLAIWAMFLGLVLGSILAAGMLSRFKLLVWFSSFYTLLIRGIPEFLVLLYVYFSADALIDGFLRIIGIESDFQLPKFYAAVIGLGMVFAVYACEILRGAYLAVDKGQVESAVAIGMSTTQLLLRIRLPQLLRYAIPALGNLWMVVLKDTSLAAVIALDELLRISKVAGETESAQLFFLICAAAIYLALAGLSDLVRAFAERKSRRGSAEV